MISMIHIKPETECLGLCIWQLYFISVFGSDPVSSDQGVSQYNQYHA